MNTFIVYTEDDTVCSKLNINLWNSRKNEIQYLDFGFMIEKGITGQSINLIVPFKLNMESIKELNSLLLGDQKLCEAIFNTLLEYTKKSNHSAKIKNLETGKEFYLPKLSLKADISVDSFYDNFTQIKIKIPDFSEAHDGMAIYLRVRICRPLLNSFIADIVPLNRSFSSAFLANEIVDFRINDVRLATDEEVRILRKNKCDIEDVHFLYIIDADEQVMLTDEKCKPRFIEHNIWNTYVDKTELKEMTAYHMRCIQEKKSQIYVFMIKNQISRCSIKTIFKYILVVIGIAVFANLVTDVLLCLLKFLKGIG
jgi:ferredoxin-fold anticodon binding domain-containing protein